MQGYKSFARRTEFEFLTGITAIVGPNGSGKSNIADAIRWALGEQSLRTLRGKTTADMIFNGGRRRARAGMAEVLLTLDNSDGWLPVDFTEVTIGRRAYRSGESEYVLNGNRVRLRDLVDLLGESGLGQRTYTVIGQGLVDAALSLRPQERRLLFEEAAGIAVHQARREEALSQLDETSRNLERVDDIIGEITPRLSRLEEQARRVREHERVSAHLLRLERTWYGYHWGQAQQAVRTAQERSDALRERLDTLRVEGERITSRLDELRQHQTQLRTTLRDAYRRTADLHDQADVAQRELAAVTERAVLLAAQQDEIQREMEPLLERQETQHKVVEAAQARAEQLRAEADSAARRVGELEVEVEQLRQQAAGLSLRQQEVQQETTALQARQEELQTALVEARANEARLEAEQELLARVREEGTGLGDGIRSVLRAGLPGTVGLLGSLIRVPAEWETAVEAALGEHARALVVESWETVGPAQESLGPGERAMLLPLSEMRSQPWGPDEASSSAEPVLRAADVVTCPDRIRPAVEALLGRTLLVEDLAAARAARAVLPAGGRCVTRTGQVVTLDGTVVIGSSSGGILARERAWQELPQRLEAARQAQDDLQRETRQVSERLALLDAARREVEAEGTRRAGAAAQMESGPLGEARTRLAVAREALSNHAALLQREQAAEQQIDAQLLALKSQSAELNSRSRAAEERKQHLQAETTRFDAELEEARAGIEPAEDELTRLSAEQEELETLERQARARTRQMEERTNAAHVEVVRCQDRLGRLQERIQEDLGLVELDIAQQVTAQTPLPLRPLVGQLPVVEVLPNGLQEEIQHLKARLRQIGPVNPSAPEEYEETLERHRFLSEQVVDLQTTSARLREVIDELDGLIEQAFLETFEAIAAAFRESFTRLFDGGTARLELSDPHDLMSTGVDIVAHPPGKRPQALALLSGGERALTAAALIFAVLRVRPTPFCVLDEVDATLDESNVVRFRSMLEELAAETQFVLITHNRGTVQAADTVYGVSMGSDGMSQVVSLRLEGKDIQQPE